MLKPICVKDHVFYRPKKNGVWITEGMPTGGLEVAPIGLAMPDRWAPYKIWHVDLWECPVCGNQIFSGSGHRSVAVQHEENFKALRERLCADKYQVNDC